MLSKLVIEVDLFAICFQHCVKFVLIRTFFWFTLQSKYPYFSPVGENMDQEKLQI